MLKNFRAKYKNVQVNPILRFSSPRPYAGHHLTWPLYTVNPEHLCDIWLSRQLKNDKVTESFIINIKNRFKL